MVEQLAGRTRSSVRDRSVGTGELLSAAEPTETKRHTRGRRRSRAFFCVRSIGEVHRQHHQRRRRQRRSFHAVSSREVSMTPRMPIEPELIAKHNARLENDLAADYEHL